MTWTSMMKVEAAAAFVAYDAQAHVALRLFVDDAVANAWAIEQIAVVVLVLLKCALDEIGCQSGRRQMRLRKLNSCNDQCGAREHNKLQSHRGYSNFTEQVGIRALAK